MLLLPPPLASVLDASSRFAGDADSQGALMDSMEPARLFVLEGGRLLEHLSTGILRTERVTELLQAARRDADRQRRALDRLEAAALRGQAAAVAEEASHLREASAALQENLRALEAEEQKEQVYSPYPELDLFLKTAMNVLDLHLPASAVNHRFPQAAALVNRLEGAAERFRLFFGHPEEAERADRALEQLHAGLGAMNTFLQTGRRVPLEDAVRLLGAGSAEVHETLAAQDAIAREESRYSPTPALEALFRGAEGPAPEEVFPRLWEGVEEALETLGDRIEGLRIHPLRALLDLPEEDADQALHAAREELGRLRGNRPSAASLAPLEAAFAAVRQAVEAIDRRLEERRRPVETAPLMADLQLMVGRALQGQVPASELRAVLDHLRSLQAEVAAEVPQTEGALEPKEVRELQDLVARQAAGLEEMARFLEDGDPDHLRRGWAPLEESTPRLAELSRGLRERIQPASSGPSGATCIRCGASNPAEARYCKSCSAVLPAMAQAPTEYADITGGEEPEATPAHVARLEGLVHRAMEGRATAEEVEAEVDELLERAERVRTGFEQQVVPQAGQDAATLEYARFFEEQMELYYAGLHTIRLFSETGQPDHLQRGLEACREAGRELMAMKGMIDQALRG